MAFRDIFNSSGKGNPITQLTRQIGQSSVQQQHGFVSQEGPSSLRPQAGPSQMEQEFFQRRSQLLPLKPGVTELQAPEHYQSWASEYEREGPAFEATSDIMASLIHNNKRNWLDTVIEMYNSGMNITVDAVIEAIYSDRPWNIKAAMLISNGNFSDNDYALFMGHAVLSDNESVISRIFELRHLELKNIIPHISASHNTNALKFLLELYPYDEDVYFNLIPTITNVDTLIYILQNVPFYELYWSHAPISTMNHIRNLLSQSNNPKAHYWNIPSANYAYQQLLNH